MESEATSRASEGRAEEVLVEQVRLLYSSAPEAYTATILNVGLLAYVQRNVVASWVLLVWVSYMLAITLCRTGLVYRYRRAGQGSDRVHRWDFFYLIGAALAGIGWGTAGLLLFPPDSIAHQVFLSFVLAGMAGGGVAALPARRATFLVFFLPTLLPVSLRLLTFGDEMHVVMGLMVLFFAGALLVIAWRTHAMIISSLNLRFANRDLIAFLTSAKERAEQLNEELAGEIARRKRTQATLRQSQEQLLQSRKLDAIGRLAGGIAHEFNNLLQVINGYGQVLARRLAPDDPGRDELDEIRKAGSRAAALTNQLLSFSRRQTVQQKVLDLNEVVTHLSGMLPRLIGEDIELVTTLDPAAGRVKADPGQLDQILINLVLNAGEAMPRGGRITLETVGLELDEEGARRHGLVRPGRYAMLAVSDTGLGMDEATKARIFEPFFTTKKPGEGLGMGLAAVYGMVQQNGGSVAADSVKGRGTIFKVYLPQTDEFPQPAVMESSDDTVKGSETVLLVEDDQSVRTLIQGVLARQGYQVLPAQDGQDALQVFGRHQGAIHLLLTDVGMPGLSGPQLADRLVPQRPHMKVLYISGYADEAMVRKGLPANNRSFLLKPFAPDILVRRVREILDAGR
jgi:signal transduction histidine kinase/CheY-like chemotaxis protein